MFFLRISHRSHENTYSLEEREVPVKCFSQNFTPLTREYVFSYKTSLVLSCLVLSCLVVSCLVLSCLVLSYLVLSCLVLSCLVLSCIVRWEKTRQDKTRQDKIRQDKTRQDKTSLLRIVFLRISHRSHENTYSLEEREVPVKCFSQNFTPLTREYVFS